MYRSVNILLKQISNWSSSSIIARFCGIRSANERILRVCAFSISYSRSSRDLSISKYGVKCMSTTFYAILMRVTLLRAEGITFDRGKS